MNLALTLFKMALVGSAHGWGEGGGGRQKSPLPKICQTYPTIMILCTVMPYLKKNWKIKKSRDTLLEFSWHQHFFTGNRQTLLYQETQMKTAYWFIISNFFNLFWVFKDLLNKHGCNFDDVRQNGYSRLS